MISIRRPMDRLRQRFSWINQWKEWFYAGVLNEALVLTLRSGNEL
jgi:hypothetical protein